MLKEYETLKNLVDRILKLELETDEAIEFLDLVAAEHNINYFDELMVSGLRILKQLRELELWLVFSKDEFSNKNAILEINAGAGGVEAQDFVQMLYRMYERWSVKHGFKFKQINELKGNVSGIKNVSFSISGTNAFGFLKGENGVHRIKRISPYSAQGKRETSFASVHVKPEIMIDCDLEIKKEDYERQMCRSGGSGGQNINKRSTAIRLIHKETGIVINSRSQRTQGENFRIAKEKLKEQLVEKGLKEQTEKFDQSFNSDKQNISFGNHIRTYSFNPTSYVKDERTEHMDHNVDSVLNGNIDEFLEKFLYYQFQEF